MFPSNSLSRSSSLFRATLFVGVGLVAIAVSAVSGKELGRSVSPSTVNGTLALDPLAFGSSAGQSNIRVAPVTWSSRANVRWNARWTNGRYMV
ncbi:MAG: hypothetical protein QM790_07295 [Nibricoccus sp.]